MSTSSPSSCWVWFGATISDGRNPTDPVGGAAGGLSAYIVRPQVLCSWWDPEEDDGHRERAQLLPELCNTLLIPRHRSYKMICNPGEMSTGSSMNRAVNWNHVDVVVWWSYNGCPHLGFVCVAVWRFRQCRKGELQRDSSLFCLSLTWPGGRKRRAESAFAGAWQKLWPLPPAEGKEGRRARVSRRQCQAQAKQRTLRRRAPPLLLRKLSEANAIRFATAWKCDLNFQFPRERERGASKSSEGQPQAPPLVRKLLEASAIRFGTAWECDFNFQFSHWVSGRKNGSSSLMRHVQT